MFRLNRPSELQINEFLASQRCEPFSYDDLKGYTVDHNRVLLGQGAEVFERAAAAVRAWKMFDTGWTEICRPDTPIEAGATVAVLARHFGFWSLNACRIVRVLDERGPERRYGFVYGTLTGHAERGEERFSVEMVGEEVWYDILAYSRPRGLARAGYPLARMLQRRFARDSKRAMCRAAGG